MKNIIIGIVIGIFIGTLTLWGYARISVSGTCGECPVIYDNSFEIAEKLIEAGLQEGDKIIMGDETFMISPIGLIKVN
jgi:hypothetical protein